MAFTDRNKKFIRKSENKYKIYLSLNILNSLIQYSIIDHPQITKKSLIDLKRLIDLIDEKQYEDNLGLYSRFKFIREILHLQLDRNIINYDLLKEHTLSVADNIMTKEDVLGYFSAVESDIEANTTMTKDEILFLSELVEEKTTYSFLYRDVDKLERVIQELRTEEKGAREINRKFEDILETLYKDIRNVKASSKHAEHDFSLGNNSAEYVIEHTIHELSKPNNHIKMGIKKLNLMLNGGLENGRCYLVFGLPKAFKSGTLLNMTLWACKYNKFETKDPNKRPAILFLTQENSVRETVARMFKHCTGDEIINYSQKEALDILRRDIMERHGVELVVKYRPKHSISTNDLDTIMDEMELEGNECVLLVQDYTKRIRSSMNYPDLRLELGEVVNDLSVIAKARNIPVLSAGQLNREAQRILEASTARNRGDIAKELNSSHVGESSLMIENTDYAFIINREKDITNEKEYLAFKLIASRAEKTKVTYFAHPFENGIRLEEDLELSSSLSLETLSELQNSFNPNENDRTISYQTPNIPKAPVSISYKRKDLTSTMLNHEIPTSGSDITF